MRRVCSLAAALMLAGGVARGETASLASHDAELERALGAALASTGIHVVEIDDEPPPRTGDVLAFARRVGARDGAAAVIWVADAGDGTSTLLVFDRDVDRVLQRPLAWAPPFGVEQAIAAARTVRTMLRALRVTPDVDSAPPAAVDAPAVREQAARRAVAPVASRPGPAAAPTGAQAAIGLESGAGLRLGGADDAGWRVTAGLAVRLRPVVVAASGMFGGADRVRAAGFDGDYRDDSLAATARVPLRSGVFVVEPALGAALHVARLAGALEDGTAVSDRRLDPAVRGQAFVGARAIGPLEIGVQVSADGLLRRQRYLMGEDEVLRLPVLQGGVDLLVRLTGM
jgi:hypothetical protein